MALECSCRALDRSSEHHGCKHHSGGLRPLNLALPRVAWHRPSLATAGRASRRNVVRKSEYQALLRPIVEKYAQESWEYWRDRIGAEPICFDGETDEGKQYQVEVEAF